MLTASSSSAAELRSGAKFDFGVAQLPYYDDVKGAPHHSLIGGGGLWVLPGKKSAEYRGVASSSRTWRSRRSRPNGTSAPGTCRSRALRTS
jgi:hypothetical protein